MLPPFGSRFVCFQAENKVIVARYWRTSRYSECELTCASLLGCYLRISCLFICPHIRRYNCRISSELTLLRRFPRLLNLLRSQSMIVSRLRVLRYSEPGLSGVPPDTPLYVLSFTLETLSLSYNGLWGYKRLEDMSFTFCASILLYNYSTVHNVTRGRATARKCTKRVCSQRRDRNMANKS